MITNENGQNIQIEDVDQFCYLGSTVTKDGGIDVDVRSRINKAWSAFATLGRVWRSSSISNRQKLHIFNSNVKSILLYGSETWRVTTGLSRQLQVFINKCLRRLLKIFWPNIITNEDLLRITASWPVRSEIQRRKWSWIGHNLRRPSDNIAKMALDWNPQGSRRRGRPKTTWRRSVECEHAGKSWLQIKRLVRNRVERFLVCLMLLKGTAFIPLSSA